jgi:mono/diheme cytochrome c family protein
VTFAKARAATAALAIPFVAAACGSGGKADLGQGRELFMNGTDGRQACSFCHSLKAAEAHGPLAPDLDLILSGDRRFNHSTTSDLTDFVRKQIHDPVCKDPNDPGRCMPYDLVTGHDAADVAAFVAQCAGRPHAAGCPNGDRLTGEAAKGRRLFTLKRCQGCHSTNGNVAFAPTFKGLAGARVELTSGKTVTASDAYLLVSILAPDAQIVQGFKPGYMTTVIKPGQLSGADARAIVAYIKTLK